MTATLHGLRVQMPPEWEDASIYRFNAPRDAEADAPPGDGKLMLQGSLMVSRHARNGSDAPERFLQLTSAEAAKGYPSFEVVRSGHTLYLDQLSAWQDARFADPRTGQAIFQRRLATVTWPQHFTLVTLTGTEAGVQRISEQIGLVHLDAEISGARVETGDGGAVVATLRSK